MESQEKSRKKPSRSWKKKMYTKREELIATLNNQTKLKKALTCGYTQESIQNMITLCEEIEKRDHKQVTAYSKKLGAYADYEQVESKIKKVYARHVEFGRILFKKDLETYNKLSLKGRRKTQTADIILQISQFYEIIKSNKAIQIALETRGVTHAECEQAYSMVDELVERYRTFNRLTEQAIETTTYRDEAREQLDTWFSEFQRLMKLTQLPVAQQAPKKKTTKAKPQNKGIENGVNN